MVKFENKTAAGAAHKDNTAATENEGSFFFITVPETYEEEELKQVRDVMMKMPADIVGGVVVVREGVTCTPFGPRR